MMNKHFSNVHIDNFVEKLSSFEVNNDDISDFLHRSVQYEMSEDVYEKMEILDNLFFDFKCKYPDLNEILEDDIYLVYFENRPDF